MSSRAELAAKPVRTTGSIKRVPDGNSSSLGFEYSQDHRPLIVMYNADEPEHDRARAHLTSTLVAVGAQDQAAFDELYRLTSAMLLGVAFRICKDRQAAEDVLHDVYLVIWHRASSWKPGRASPNAWLATVARNRAIDWYRAQGIRRATPLDCAPDSADPAPSVEAMLVDVEEWRSVLTYLAELPILQRNAIRSAFFDGLTYGDLARLAGVPESTAKSWIRRGLKRLKERLQQDQ